MTCVVAAALPALGVTQGDARPDLAVTAAAEPPDFEVAGAEFGVYFTVSNQGRGAAGASTARAFLSSDQRRGAGDVAIGSRSVPGLRAGGQVTRQARFTIPASIPDGLYHLVICADATGRVTESDNGDNCRSSGQRMGVDRVEGGPAGPQGPPGARGERGDSGADFGLRRVRKAHLQFGVPNIDDAPGEGDDGGGFDEGSTSSTELISVGPLRFRALCRMEPDSYESDESTSFVEAKVLVETDSGTMSFVGANGKRGNVGAESKPGAEGANGGEGKRQILSVEARQPGQAAFQATSGFVAHSSGTHVALAGLYAGIRTSGAGDGCAFGGGVRVIAP